MIRWVMVWAVLGGGDPGGLKEIGEFVAKGQWGTAHRRVATLERDLARKAPLEVLDGRLLREPAAGLGIYEPAKNGEVQGADIYLYAHVRNHSSRKSPGGHELHLVTDLVVLSPGGETLAEDKGFGVSRFTSRTEHRDTFVNVGIKSRGLPPGRYVFKLVIHDRIGGKQGAVTIPVVVPRSGEGGG